MEKVKNRKYRNLLTAIILLVFAISGCNKQNDLGIDLLPPGDILKVKNTILKDDISAYTFLDDSVNTNNTSKSLLGSFNDPIFGNTTINFATQFRIQAFPKYGTNPEVDSTFLYLYYRTVYGDTTTTQRIKVYELKDPIYYDTTDSTGITSNSTYFHDVDLKPLAYPQVIGQLDFIPIVALDSASSDTLFQVLKVPIDISIANKLVFADSLNLISGDAFLNYFKGVFVETEKLNSDTGAIISLDAEKTDDFMGSALVVYYNNDENKADTTPDTLNMAYYITQFSARVNSFSHDYSSTPFYSNLNSETIKDSLIYVQSLGGLESKIEIANLSSWRDSVVVIGNDTVRYGINKAELIFQVDSAIANVKKFPPPKQLLFTFIDSTNNRALPMDYSFNPEFYGGALADDYTYRFNITQHLQQIINGNIENRGFYLMPANRNSQANRVVIKGSTSNKGIRLVITYTEISP